MLGGDHIMINASQFVNCDGGTWANGVGKGAAYWDITVQNTFFQGHVLQMTCGGGCDASGQFMILAKDPTTGQQTYVHLYYNTIPNGSYFQDWQPGGDYEIIGNIFGDVSPNHGRCVIEGTNGNPDVPLSIVKYNLFAGDAGACGGVNYHGDVRYVNATDRAAGIDLRLRSGSPGLRHGDPFFRPSTDIFGTLRPRNVPADLGAWQHQDARLVLGRSMGGLSVGMTRSRVEAGESTAFNHGSRRSRRVVAYGRSGETIIVSYGADNKVVTLSTRSRYYSTLAGFGVGSRMSGVDEPRRFRWRECSHSWTGTRNGSRIDVQTSGRTGAIRAITFHHSTVLSACR